MLAFEQCPIERKTSDFRPLDVQNRRHSASAGCRLFCCPILFSRCRLCSFLKLLSYRHTAKGLLLFCAPSGERLLSAQSAEGKCGVRAAGPHPPFSFPRKKTGGVTVQKKGVYIASLSSKNFCACRCYFLRAALPRLELLYDLACSYHPLPLCPSCRSAQ